MYKTVTFIFTSLPACTVAIYFQMEILESHLNKVLMIINQGQIEGLL